MLQEFLALFGPTIRIFGFIFRFWWIWATPFSVMLFFAILRPWRQNLYKQSIEWIFLELKFPSQIEKSPKAMEQVLATIHNLWNGPGDIIESYWDGQVTLWHSLEIVSLQGEIHFLMRIPKKFQKIIEGNLYAHYPTIEIQETEDYMTRFPETYAELKLQNYEAWGAELVLDKPDAYPIRTYTAFENLEESMALDPISGLLEVLSRVSPGENMMIQMLIRPTKDGWKKEGEKIIEELRNKGVKKVAGPQGESTDRPMRTPGETDVIKAVENNLSKVGFETLIRFIYVAHESKFSPDFARRGVTSSFNQYGAQNLNSFRRNSKITTDTRWTYFPFFFSKQRAEARKHRIYAAYRVRMMPEPNITGKLLNLHILNFNISQRVFVLNTEEIATLYHPPTQIVLTGQILKHIPSKKLGPPSGLPIFDSGEQDSQ